MSESTKPKQGTFCWTELMTRDAAAAKAFYTELIGWTTSEMPMGGAGTYTMFTPPGAKESVGGMMQMDGPEFEGLPPHWMPYIAVDDVDASAEKVKALGGSIKMPPTDIPNIGRFCVIEDPTGAVISLFTSRG
ncbi:MAG: VOC family protein [Phycisphaerales bacterium]|nr:VOC family protein [Phycisphaerales bacterium]